MPGETPDTPARLGRGGEFHGWRMVGVAFLVDFIAVGFFFYSYGVYFKAIAVDLGGGERFDTALGITVANVVGAVVAPAVGRALDRHSIKTIMMAGAVCVSIGFGLLSAAAEKWQYYFVLGTLFGFGLSMLGGMSSGKLVTNWFVARRGMALGIATMGVSLSGLVMPTVATWLIAHLGWRGGFQVYAVCTCAIVVPLVARFAVNRPEDVGQRPDGDGPDDDRSESPREIVAWSTADILRSRNFWALALPFSLSFAALSAVLMHLVPYADDIGIPAYRAAWLLSAAAGAGVVGKLAFGWLVDRSDPRIAVWCSFGTQVAGLLLLMQEPTYGGLAFGALVFGFGMGGVIPLQGAVAGAAFGRLSFGKVMGLLRPVAMPVHAIGIPLAGWIHDRTGGYDLAFQFFLGVYAVAMLIVATLRVDRDAVVEPEQRVSSSETGLA